LHHPGGLRPKAPADRPAPDLQRARRLRQPYRTFRKGWGQDRWRHRPSCFRKYDLSSLASLCRVRMCSSAPAVTVFVRSGSLPCHLPLTGSGREVASDRRPGISHPRASPTPILRFVIPEPILRPTVKLERRAAGGRLTQRHLYRSFSYRLRPAQCLRKIR